MTYLGPEADDHRLWLQVLAVASRVQHANECTDRNPRRRGCISSENGPSINHGSQGNPKLVKGWLLTVSKNWPQLALAPPAQCSTAPREKTPRSCRSRSAPGATWSHSLEEFRYIYIYIYMCIYIYVYMYMYICVYTYIRFMYIHIQSYIHI